MKNIFTTKIAAAATLAATLGTIVAPAIAKAETLAETYYATPNGGRISIVAGSTVQDVLVTEESITFTVPEGEAADLRTVGHHRALENSLMRPTCNLIDKNVNQLFVVGPATVTLTPSFSNCSNSDSDVKDTMDYTFSVPAADAVLKSGSEVLLLWGHDGPQPASVRLRLSVDGGKSFPTELTPNIIDSGFFNWTVPDMPSSSKAVIKIEAFTNNAVSAFAVSDLFKIEGTSPEPVDETPDENGGLIVEPYDYDVEEETRTAETIGVDKGLVTNAPAQICHPDSRIKAKDSPAVYYCGADGKRYVFPNFATYATWYGDDFNGVMELDIADVARIPLGGNVTYRPGVRMVKLTTAPDVFAVAADGTLRYVTEKVAVRLYGANWNKMIDDLPDTFFVDYKIGEPVKE